MSNEYNNAVPVSKFIEQANALLRLDDANALAPHGIGGFARELLTEAIRLLSEAPASAPAPAVPQGEPLGYINDGHLHEMQSGRVPYVYVYAAPGVGAETPVYTAPAAQSQPDMQQREPWVCGTGIVTPHELREQSTPSQPVTEQETLVGLSIHGKELRKENIVYDGGPLDLTDCKLLSCHIEFSKAAARTVQFLAIAEQSQPGFLQPLFADAVRLTKPSKEPVTLTDEQWRGLKAAHTYLDSTANCMEPMKFQHAAALKSIIAALREKGGV